MKSCLPLFSLFLTVSLLAAEIPPWLPPANGNIPRLETVSHPAIPDGPAATPGAFCIERSLNGIWKLSNLENSVSPFSDSPEEERRFSAVDLDDSAWNRIPVPLNWYEKFPGKRVKGKPYVRGWYRTEFLLTEQEREGKRVVLKFDVAGYDAKVFLNGKYLGSHKGDFTPFELDATDAAKNGKNVLAVRIISDLGTTFGLKQVSHPYGAQWGGYSIKGGLWQSVRLSLEPEVRIRKLLVTPFIRENRIEVDYTIYNHTGKTLTAEMVAQITPAARGAHLQRSGRNTEKRNLLPGESKGRMSISLNDPRLWTPENPWLYYLNFRILVNDTPVSGAIRRFGFREFRTADGKFYLNGKQVYLFGQNLSSVNYGGKRTVEEDRKRLEDDIRKIRSLGYNIVRTPHMPILPLALELCDEFGLMVYYEWAWCFDNQLAPDFESNNLRELGEFVETGYNHPSVVMWVLGNEIRHRDRPDVVRLLDRQTAEVRRLDRSRRPISTFSGAAGWLSYGRNKLDTDVLDFHNYTSLYGAWTGMPDVFRKIQTGLEEIYGPDFPQALVAWENVGFSWGARPDPAFRRGDRKLYAAQMRKPTSWGMPNGVGFVGSSPLFKALSPGFGEWAQTRFGHRIFEYYRRNPDYAGFSPWFNPIPASTLWTQRVYPSLCDRNNLFPHNLFSGETTQWNLRIANDGSETFRNVSLELSLFDGEREQPFARLPIPELPAHGAWAKPYSLTLPKLSGSGFRQLRLALKQGERRIGQNFYDLFLADRAELEGPLSAARAVRILDTGAAGNVRELADILTRLRIPFEKISSIGRAPAGSVVIVPPEIREEQTLNLNGSEITEWIQRKQGTLLVLEQRNPRSIYPGGRRLTADSVAYTDMVLPDHPIFRGMEYRNLESWNNPDHAYVVDFSFMPYSEEALAVKGPRFSHSNVGCSLVELRSGGGRMIFSQLNAVRCAPVDPSASLYLRNLLAYATGKEYEKDTPELDLEKNREYRISEKRAVSVDLSASANRSFRDDVSNDGKGGWTDEGENDFRTMPLGNLRAAGIPFHILDPEKNHGKSCLVVRGTVRPHLPAAIRGIRIGRKFSRIFFLHTSTWGGNNQAGSYRFHYADGSVENCPLIGGWNIGDWWNVFSLPSARIGLQRENPKGQKVACYVTEWENPKPEVEITSMDFLSLSASREGEIDWNPENAAIPVLIAVTGEETNPNRLKLTGKADFLTARGIREVLSKVSGEVKIRKEKEDVCLEVFFPSYQGNNVPGAWIGFRKEGVRGPYESLTCEIRSRDGGALQLRLPGEKWKDFWTAYLNVPGDGKWHSYRLFFDRDFQSFRGNGKNPIDFTRIRPELFLFSRPKFKLEGDVPAHTFEIRNVVLE